MRQQWSGLAERPITQTWWFWLGDSALLMLCVFSHCVRLTGSLGSRAMQSDAVIGVTVCPQLLTLLHTSVISLHYPLLYSLHPRDVLAFSRHWIKPRLRGQEEGSSGHALVPLPDSCHCNRECTPLPWHWHGQFCTMSALPDMQSGLVLSQSATVVSGVWHNFRLGSFFSLSYLFYQVGKINFPPTVMDGFGNPLVTQLLYPSLFHPVYNVGAVIVLASDSREYLNVYFQAES